MHLLDLSTFRQLVIILIVIPTRSDERPETLNPKPQPRPLLRPPNDPSLEEKDGHLFQWAFS